MDELFLGIITHPSFPILTGMVGYLIGHYFAIGRDKRKEFSAAADKFREVFNQALVDLQHGRFGMLGFGGSFSDDVVKAHRLTYLNFRPHLRGEYRNQYDKAWYKYCGEGMFPREEDIKQLLEFTEYKFFRHIVFLCGKYTSKSPPSDKEKKELMEKFIKSLHDK